MSDAGYASLEFTRTFLESFASREFTAAERASFLTALQLPDTNERHPSLRVRKLAGDLSEVWSVSAPDVLRITFLRVDENRKRLLTCSRHYQR